MVIMKLTIIALALSSICWGAELPQSPSTVFKAATMLQIGGLIADGITTAQIPGQHWNGDQGNPCVEKWSPMLYGRMPSAGRVAGVMAAEFAATQTLAHLARRGLFGNWVARHDYLFPAANGASHWIGAVNNFRSACR